MFDSTFLGSSMVEQLPVKRQLSGVIQIEKRSEFGETPTMKIAGNPEPSPAIRGKGVETIPQGSSAGISGTKRFASDSFKLG